MSVNIYNKDTKVLTPTGGNLNISDISDMIADVNHGDTAERNYANGDMFTWNDMLYEATTAITLGDTLVEGTNCDIADSLADQVKEVNDNFDNKQDKTDNNLNTTSKTIVGAINELESGKQDKLTNPLTQADVVDNLTSTSTTAPLSAKQGKELKTLVDGKQDVLINPLTQSDVVDNLTSTSTVLPLSAKQGKELKTLVDGKQDTLTNPLTQSDVVDNLTSTSQTLPLSAAMGKSLYDMLIPVDITNTVTGNSEYFNGKPYVWKIGKMLLISINLYNVKDMPVWTAVTVGTISNVMFRTSVSGTLSSQLSQSYAVEAYVSNGGNEIKIATRAIADIPVNTWLRGFILVPIY